MTISIPAFPKREALRGALSTCAIEGYGVAREALETLRRIEAGDEVGEMYVKRFNLLLKFLGFECEVSK